VKFRRLDSGLCWGGLLPCGAEPSCGPNSDCQLNIYYTMLVKRCATN
jgi:hypothetical protein